MGLGLVQHTTVIAYPYILIVNSYLYILQNRPFKYVRQDAIIIYITITIIITIHCEWNNVIVEEQNSD